MGLNYLDWTVIVFYFGIIIAIALYYYLKAKKNTQEFFLSGRNMPWWLAGTAMVATTFAADTPLAVTELVVQSGISGNWLWWNMAVGCMLTVFFYARLWRRANIVTDVEFVEMRYSGKPAAALRGFRALYLGLFMNAIVIAWVNKAMEKIFQVSLPDVDAFTLIILCTILIAIYSCSSGLLGSARIDAIQFVIAMSGCILLAVLVVKLPGVDGLAGLKAKLSAQVFSFTPVIVSEASKSLATSVVGGVLALSTGAFVAHIALQWWASWYPGSDPGGGGYVAQRMMSAKDESHSLFATLWFTVANYCLRPWPWIIVAMTAMVLLPTLPPGQMQDKKELAQYTKAFQIFQNAKISGVGYAAVQPDLDSDTLARVKKFEDADFRERFENATDPGKMYPKLMVRYLPSGLLGLMIAVFLAAYMSTISAQFNWGTSYIVNDFYRRFLKKDASEMHYVWVSRFTIFLQLIFSMLITRYLLTTISGAWEFIINASAGLGSVLILRWFWWRINAWSEISAMIAPLVIYPIAHYYYNMESPMTLYPTVIGTTIIWLVVTFITKPASKEILASFYAKIHPGGWGWKKIAAEYPNVRPDTGYPRLFVNWISGVVVVYAILYATGKILFGEYVEAIVSLAIASICTFIIYWNIQEERMQA